MLSKIILFSLAMIILYTGSCKAECCFTEKTSGGYDFGYCADGFRGTPCCGNGDCNIFCCNCDNACRKMRNFLDLHTGKSEEDVFDEIDKDKDTFISKDEFVNALSHRTYLDKKALEEHFSHINKEKNGKMSFDEFVAAPAFDYIYDDNPDPKSNNNP